MATKSEILKALENLGDDDRAPVFLQADLEDVLQKRLAKESAKLGAATDALSDLQAKLKSAEAKLGEVEEQASLKGKGDLEKLQHELEKIQRAHQALADEKTAAENRASEAQAQRKQDFLKNSVRNMLLKAERFDPKSLEDALDLAMIRLDGVFEVVENGQGLKAVAKDPNTLAEVDAFKAVSDFVAARPAFQVAAASGGGSDPAHPAAPPAKKTFADLQPGADQIAYALQLEGK